MSQSAPQLSPFAVFRNRSFRLLWSGQLVSTIGDALTALAAGILVYRLTGSALSVGLMLMATSLPSLLFGLFGGVMADRYDRKRIMVGACLVQALFVALIPPLLPFGIAWLYVLVALSSCARQFYSPAYESVLPELATDEELAAANSLMSISTVGSTAVGYAAAGLLAAQIHLSWVFYLDALTFVVAGLCIMGITVQKLGNDEETSVAMVVRNMRRGLDYLFSHRVLRAVLLIGFGIGCASGVYNTLTLPFTITVLGASEFVFGVQEALTSVGFVVGSFVMASFAGRLSERSWMALSISGLGVAGFFYTFSSAVPAAVLFFAIIGFFNAPAIIAIRLLFQRKTPATLRGRVIGAYFVGVEGAIIVGMGLGGLADSFGIRTLLVVASILTVTMGLLAAVLPGLSASSEEAKDADTQIDTQTEPQADERVLTLE